MRPATDLLEVGRVDRPHGINGEVLVSLVTNRTERLDAGAVLQTADTTLVVRRARPRQNRWLVAFEGYEDRDTAEGLRGATLLAVPLEDPDELWVHRLIGAEVISADGLVRGTVSAVQANPASDLLVTEGGALVPLTFVVRVEEGDGGSARIVVDAPAGLFELP
ncbi:MAG: 16S rRNA processing protein RimM [Acidimicrobiia bacterium]|nr:16S rRNA processing protein RimM [Acidimicrobiia bacterium]